MGEDGAKLVVVNSVGREIRSARRDKPTEGKRLQLTIDADIQKAVEEAFDATDEAGLPRAPLSCSIQTPGRCSRSRAVPAYDPNAFAAGIDRATWNQLTSDDRIR